MADKKEFGNNEQEERLKQMLLTPGEQTLLDVLFGSEWTENAMHTLLDNFDIDHANQNYILMLSCLGYMKNWKYFPHEIIPRLKGVHRYYQVRNSMGIPWLVKQLRILSDAGIQIMLIKVFDENLKTGETVAWQMALRDAWIPVVNIDCLCRGCHSCSLVLIAQKSPAVIQGGAEGRWEDAFFYACRKTGRPDFVPQ